MSDLKVGDEVKVKEGVMCPDFEDLDIGGWQGEIIEILNDEDNVDDVLVCIKWNNKTLGNMPRRFIDQGEEEGLDNDVMYLNIEDVEPVNLP